MNILARIRAAGAGAQQTAAPAAQQTAATNPLDAMKASLRAKAQAAAAAPAEAQAAAPAATQAAAPQPLSALTRMQQIADKVYRLIVIRPADCNCGKCNVPFKVGELALVVSKSVAQIRTAGKLYCMRCGEHALRQDNAAWLDLQAEHRARTAGYRPAE